MAGQTIARTAPGMHHDYQAAISNPADDDIAGSPFAVQDYTVHSDLGGNESLEDLRQRLHARGLRLMLDFVPNHTATDHHWVQSAPHRYVEGSEEDLKNRRDDYFVVEKQTDDARRILAHGKDPYFPGWTDTAQLDYSNPDTQGAMKEELKKVAGQCDGVRCDMAMLLLPDVFEGTWGRSAVPFWPDAIAAVRAAYPAFLFMAEVYWGREWDLQQQGFDYTYDKVLYDRLIARDVEPVRLHLQADLAFQTHLARFLENHDEPRIAAKLPMPEHQAAAVVAFNTPGLRFLHDGQLTGARRKPAVQLRRRENEPVDARIAAFYDRLLPCLAATANGLTWQMLPAQPTWDGNRSHQCLLCFGWSSEDDLRHLIAVNYCGQQTQAYLPLPYPSLRGRQVTLVDQLSEERYLRSGEALQGRGLFLDLAPWRAHWFTVER